MQFELGLNLPQSTWCLFELIQINSMQVEMMDSSAADTSGLAQHLIVLNDHLALTCHSNCLQIWDLDMKQFIRQVIQILNIH